VISPLFPKRRMMLSVSEKGGEMTGRVARVDMNFLPPVDVRSTRKAKAKPRKVENVAVMMPSCTDPQRAVR